MAAEAAISSVVHILGDLLIQKVRSLRHRYIEKKVDILKDELKRMQSFLKDANRKQAEDDRIRNWISEIREVAQDAQDTIELFLLNVENSKSSPLIKSITTLPKRLYYTERIGEEIDSIIARLDAIDKSRHRYGIKDFGDAEADSARNMHVERQRRLPCWQNDKHVVGLEDDVRRLLQETIMDEKRGLAIAVVEGMGGIGKTTLARKIYNLPDVTARFESRGWAVVSSEFTPQETIKQLILELSTSGEKRKLIEEIKILEESTKAKLYIQCKLNEMLHGVLENKSYFIVLDDVWEKEHLQSLITAFPNIKDKTSRLLITSRDKITTNADEYVHKMKLLDPKKSWELFLKKAFIGVSSNGKCPEKLECIGRQILEKCHGLPLAISMVGGLLVKKQTQSQWSDVLKQLKFYLGRGERSALTILEVSYHNLSPLLKSCFLCLAFFKEDTIIPTRKLVDIWVAHGLIQQQGSNRTIDEIARGYLDELIERSMVQIEDLTIDNRVKNCRLHDLVYEVCLRIAKDEIGLEIVKGQKVMSSESSGKPRHRVVYGRNLEASLSSQNQHIRSLFLLNDGDNSEAFTKTPYKYWKCFQLLKTLDLDGLALQRFPDSFELLIGLKNLKIYRHEYRSQMVLELPSWLNKLKNLEVLCVENDWVMFPNVTLKMERLRQLHVHGVTGTRAMTIRNWTDIETLNCIRLQDLHECRSTLISSCHIRELGICVDGNNTKEEDMIMTLEKMESLVELRLNFSSKQFSKPWFEMKSKTIADLESLTKLKLIGWEPTSFSLSKFPPNLSQLMLKNMKIVVDPMPILGLLPKLKYLKISKYVHKLWRIKVLSDGFPCLEVLSLKGMTQLRGIDIEEGGMPQLEQLRVLHCPALETKNLEGVYEMVGNGVLALTIKMK